jgi:hypothetical protein
VAHEVTNVGHDRDQLSNMAQLARDATGARQLIALADRGYFEGYEILKCEQAGIATLVPKPMTSNSTAEGRFDKRDFLYDEHGKTLHKYWTSACPTCRSRASAHRVLIAALPAGARSRA